MYIYKHHIAILLNTHSVTLTLTDSSYYNMAPNNLFRRKKRMNISCEPPALTSACMISDQGPTSFISSSRRIDRSTSQLIDSRRVKVPPGLSRGCDTPVEVPVSLFSPASSSRCLLNDVDDSAFFDVFPNRAIVAAAPVRMELSRFQAPNGASSTNTVLRPASPQEQAVVLRVSLHCRACEGKVKKHISKMEGVSSFNVDMVSKKVTVVGDVTPLGVLNSITKVKNAHFWRSPPKSRQSTGFPGRF